MKHLIYSLIVLCSFQSFAQTKRILPIAQPDFVCISSDQAWELLVNVELGLIRVVDRAQNQLSHTVEGLRNDSKNGIVKLYNYQGRNYLPSGIVFQADLKYVGLNAFTIDDLSGKRTFSSCKK